MALWSCLVAEAPRFFSLRCLALPQARWTLSQNGYQGFKKETEEASRPFKAWSLECTCHLLQIVLVWIQGWRNRPHVLMEGEAVSLILQRCADTGGWLTGEHC